MSEGLRLGIAISGTVEVPRPDGVDEGRLMQQTAMQLAARSSVVLLALAAIGVVVPTAARNEGPSYEAGYTAATSNPKFVRLALSDRGMSSASFCDELLQRTITGA